MAADGSERPARKDAVRNRARLVEAAAGAFRAEGLGVSVNAIARSAGVNLRILTALAGVEGVRRHVDVLLRGLRP